MSIHLPGRPFRRGTRLRRGDRPGARRWRGDRPGARRWRGERPGTRRWRGERGDVPGWVLITVMSAGLVAALWAVAGPELSGMLREALNSVRG